MIVTVQVTQEDIDAGVKYHPFRCPIAVAVSRALSNREVSIGADNIRFPTYVSSPDPKAALPVSAQSFIQDFDSGRPVRPFEFDIEVPEDRA